MQKKFSVNNLGFTLVELMVVISIIALLAGLLSSALDKSLKSGHSARCLSNLKQIGLGIQMYADGHDVLPAATNMPSLNINTLPALPEALEKFVGKDIFECPGDDKYYKEEMSSYEWETMLNGISKNIFSGGIQFFHHKIKPEDTRALWDYEAFHGSETEEGGRNILYLDLHSNSL